MSAVGHPIAGDLEAEPRPAGALRRLGRRVRGSINAHSIRIHLYSIFALLFVLVIGLGSFGITRLSGIDRASEVIRNHWLRDTGILGDLANYMSDTRTAEASHLLSSTPLERAASAKDVDTLRGIVAASQRAYEAIEQDPAQAALYAQFAQRWSAYLEAANRVIALENAGRGTEAVELYHGDSRRAFDAASDVLSRLTDETIRRAREDSERAAVTYAHARTMVLIAMVLAAGLLLAVVLYITRRILSPLLTLADCMHALAHQNTDLVIPSVRRGDEIGEMARAVEVFRNNAVTLVASQRRSIEQAAALEEGLENERLVTAQQRDFVSMTSHEFRTPLTIIDGHAQRLIKMSERLEPEDVAERGTRIRSAVQRITHIMDSLLAASHVLDGRAAFHPSEIDPRALLADACQAHRDATRGAMIAEDLDALPSVMRGDAKLLFHVFSNLISNAIKFSPPGSPVEVAAREEEGALVVSVRDRGIGIPARDRERLFERYFRGSNATAIAGTGVGLHLVAMVVKLHRGEVFAESLEGVGSRFIVRLPIR